VEAVRGSDKTGRGVPPRDNAARCSPGNGSGDVTQGWRVAAWGRRPRHMDQLCGNRRQRRREQRAAAWGLESKGGRWERDGQREWKHR
jgi:hypothetical protein